MQAVPWMPTVAVVEHHVSKLATTPLALAGPIAKQALKSIAEFRAMGSIPEEKAVKLELTCKQKLAEVALWQKQKQDGLEQLTLHTQPSLPAGNTTGDPTSLTE